MKDFTDKIAVVTGAAGGIGLALTERLVEGGCHVVGADVQADLLDEALEPLGARAQPYVIDVSDHEAMNAMADEVYAEHGAVHMLCNNAGVTVRTSLLTATHQDWEWVLGVNLWGVINGINAFVPRMIDGGQPGHVVNTGSLAGFLTGPRFGIYCTTKHAIVGLSESLAADLAEVGAPIGVTVPCPGPVATGFARPEASRPERLGRPPLTEDGEAEARRIEAGLADAPSADDVVDRIMHGMATGELFVFPDAAAPAPVRARFDRILGA